MEWVLPLDENYIPYEVKLKYSYTTEPQSSVTYRRIVSGASCKVVDLPSDTSVEFSFRAINKQKNEGPITSYTIKTKKSGEPLLCYMQREYITYTNSYIYTCTIVHEQP